MRSDSREANLDLILLLCNYCFIYSCSVMLAGLCCLDWQVSSLSPVILIALFNFYLSPASNTWPNYLTLSVQFASSGCDRVIGCQFVRVRVKHTAGLNTWQLIEFDWTWMVALLLCRELFTAFVCKFGIFFLFRLIVCSDVFRFVCVHENHCNSWREGLNNCAIFKLNSWIYLTDHFTN